MKDLFYMFGRKTVQWRKTHLISEQVHCVFLCGVKNVPLILLMFGSEGVLSLNCTR